MCVIERKTYESPDGQRRIVETSIPCPRAVGSQLCKHVRRRSFDRVQVSETRPSSTTTTNINPSDGYIVTEGTGGRQRVYRDLSKRSSNSSSVRRSTTMSDRSSVTTPSSTSSPSPYVEVKPEAPSPPPAAPGFAFVERVRAPYPPPPDPSRIITPDGTAIYGRPPSLELPRATNNERPFPPRKESDSSVSSTRAEVDELVQPSSSKTRRRPSIKIDTTARPSTSSSSAYASSPGLSDLPGVSRLRSDSAKHMSNSSSRKAGRSRADSSRQARSEQERRRQEEDDHQARLERERLAGTDRRQSTREALLREASRERHRQDAAAALEGQQRLDDPVQRRRDAEYAQMARERAATAARERGSHEAQRYSDDQASRYADDQARRYVDEEARRYADDQLRRDAELRARYQEAQRSPLSARRRMTGEEYGYGHTTRPISARSPSYTVAVHQYPSARTISERGEEVIAREQARAATERLSSAVGGMSMEDDVEYDYVDVDDFGGERRRRRRQDRWL